ncbi:hypothetical protein Scep_012024 [Stephania cephalantha]|uniref:Uncharacterized protein n=1 Tax=Stephania cephalantha TaxID=152367 RepID=A0AAP0JFU1_9MAGN
MFLSIINIYKTDCSVSLSKTSFVLLREMMGRITAWFSNNTKEKETIDTDSSSSSSSPAKTSSWRRLVTISPLRLKRIDFQLSIVEDFLFKIFSVLEAVILVSALCLFFLCCGCHF